MTSVWNLNSFGNYRSVANRGFALAAATLLVIATSFAAVSPASAKPAYASVIMDAETGKFIYARNADALRYPASLTKMMTLYLMFEALDRGHLSLSSKIRISPKAAKRPASKLGLPSGAHIKVKDAIYALATKSANDIATAVAEELGGTERRFAKLMTRKARKLGMKRTTFKNASGLTAKGQITTARDMAILGRRLMNDYPQYYHVFSRESFDYNSRTYKSHNKLLNNYTGTDGIKTGYTGKSGFNLVASVKRKGRHLIGAVFGGKTSKSRDAHMIEILDKAFTKLPAKATHQRVAKGVYPMPPDSPFTGASRLQVAAAAAPAAPVTPPKMHTVTPVNVNTASITGADPLADIIVRTQMAIALPRINPNRTMRPQIAIPAASPKTAGWSTASTTAPTPQPVALPKAGSQSGQWGLQVGAFTHSRTAGQHLVRLSDQYSGILDSAEHFIVPYASGNATIYRARLQGFEESSARDACRRLTSDGVSCVPVPPELFAQGSAE